MKFIIIALAAIILAPGAAFATEPEVEAVPEEAVWAPSNLEDLTITVVPKERILKKECNWRKKYGTLNGCFFKGTDSMYIRSNMDHPEFAMVFFHELGHFYTQDKRASDMRIFRDRERDTPRENVAEDFALYMTAPYLLTPEKIAWFDALQVDKEATMAALMANWPY